MRIGMLISKNERGFELGRETAYLDQKTKHQPAQSQETCNLHRLHSNLRAVVCAH